MKDFLVIVITLPEFIADEAMKIEKLLAGGIDYVHIRKPGSSSEQMERLLTEISPAFRRKLKLHDHFDLAEKYDVAGVQLNSRNPEFETTTLTLSKSCHSLEEVEKEYNNKEYVTLSPIYDSISKEGYHSKFDIEKIKRNIANKNVIAIGGVTPKKLPELKNAGFRGAAMLGCVWNDIDEFLSGIS